MLKTSDFFVSAAASLTQATQVDKPTLLIHFDQSLQFASLFEVAVKDIGFTQSSANLVSENVSLFCAFKYGATGSDERIRHDSVQNVLRNFLTDKADVGACEFLSKKGENGVCKIHCNVRTPSYASNMTDLVRQINKSLANLFVDKLPPTLEFDTSTRLLTQVPKQLSGSNIYVYADFGDFLRTHFKCAQSEDHDGRTLQSAAAVENFSSTSVLVESSLVSGSYFNGSLRPILRLVPLDGTFAYGRLAYHSFPNPHYIKLNHHTITDLDITLRYPATMQPVSFEFGEMYINLHFRPVN